jgi:spore coat protein A, manganese oxidase
MPEIAMQQFQQQILPSGLPSTTVWGYGSYGDDATFHAPSFTIEATYNKPVRVKWINNLIDKDSKRFLPHILPVDQTLHWANPPGGAAMRDHRGEDPESYAGPVPMVTHVHGAHVSDESDGYAEAWFLPPASNIPSGYATEGTWYDHFKTQFKATYGDDWAPGSAIAQYNNDQDATTLWYHDHTLGMTRCNVYAGPAGFYLLRGGPREAHVGALPGPAPKAGDAPGTKYYEIPIVIQDRSFNSDGSLFFPSDRAFFEGLTHDQLQIPFIPDGACSGISDISPIWNPEFFGNTMMVNGNTWPFLEVEPRRYRIRFLNGCNARFLILKLDNDMSFYQIGAEGGFLPAPIRLGELLIAPAERADVIIDFTGQTPGTEIILQNVGPDEPYNGDSFEPADPATTGQVMQFRVAPLASVDNSTPPMRLKLPPRHALPPATVTRQVSLNELASETVMVAEDPAGNGNIVLACGPGGEPFEPREAMLGTVNLNGDMPMGMPMMWMDHITENPATGATEIWEMYNFTMDAHPMHIHQVMFEVVNRQAFDMNSNALGSIIPPDPDEAGVKDTVIAYPGQITRVKAKFDIPGLFVWHCHIIDHEDNEMMRPFAVGLIPTP